MTTSTLQFTRVDARRIALTIAEAKKCQVWLLTRLAEYTRTGAAVDEHGRLVEAIKDPFAHTQAGYGSWRVGEDWGRRCRHRLGRHLRTTSSPPTAAPRRRAPAF